MPRLSIVIPVVAFNEPFEATLISVLENRPPECEVVAAHVGPYCDPYHLAGEVRFLKLPRGRDGMYAALIGMQAAEGEIIHLLECGFQATPGWTEPALEHFYTRNVGSVAPCIELAHAGGVSRVAGLDVSRGGGRRLLTMNGGARQDERKIKPLGPLFVAAFYRREALRRVEGFEHRTSRAVADLDLAARLAAAGYVCASEPNCLVRAAPLAAQTNGSPLRPARGFAYGRDAERMFQRHCGDGRLPLALSPAMHLATVAGEALGSLAKLRPLEAAATLAGRAAGWWTSKPATPAVSTPALEFADDAADDFQTAPSIPMHRRTPMTAADDGPARRAA